MNRRIFLGQSAALFGATVGLNNIALASTKTKGKVVVVGAGYGGATAAKYIRMLSNSGIEVTLIEPNAEFVSCPLSNLVIGGVEKIDALTTPYTGLSAKHGVNMIKDTVTKVDAKKKTVTTASGTVVPYDKLILAPGIGLNFGAIEGLEKASRDGIALQAWSAGP